MSIIRTQHNKENPYVILNKSTLEDPNLSWPSKGLWAYLMSKPDNWQVSVSHLSTIYNERGGGKEAIYNYLNELIEQGYCKRQRLRDKQGRVGEVEYIISEFKNKVPQTGLPDVDLPDVGKTATNDKREDNKNIDLKDTISSLSNSQENIVSLESFDVYTYKLRNGLELSLRTQRSWAKYKNQDRKNLVSAIQYYEQQFDKGKQIPNHEAYIQKAHKEGYAIKQDNKEINTLWVKYMKEEYDLIKLEILKSYIVLDRGLASQKEISLNINNSTFSNILDDYIKRNKK